MGAVLEEPVVVGLDHGQVKLGVGGARHAHGEAGGREVDPGVDAGEVHLDQAGRGVVAAGADFLPGGPTADEHRVFSGRGVEAELDGVSDAFDDPGVTALVGEELHAGDPVSELGGHPARPQVRRLVDVLVC